jgi:hypothetical protein
MNDEEWRDLERRSRAAFDASVEAQDGATRSRLARARSAALAELKQRRAGGPLVWLPAGAAAAAIFAAVLWQRGERAVEPPGAAAIAYEDLDIVAGGEDFALLGEDADFLAWAVAESYGDVG